MNPQAFQELWPLGLYLFLVLALVAGMLILSALLGQRSRAPSAQRPARDEPFESGIVSIGFGRFRVSAHFYLVAMLFVLFDLEVVYIIAWAIAWDAVGWYGYWGLLVFVGILVAGLVWEWRMGALEWHPGGRTVPEIQRPLQLRKGGS
jgi:NADH-quinone oxidoreductase subunit A